MRPIAEIIIHCSATQPQWMEGKPINEPIKEIDRWHRNRGFREIGYHYVIDRRGNVGLGRPVSSTGAHVKGHNTGTIGVCLLGGHGSASTDKFHDNFTPEQDKALRGFLKDMRKEFPTISKFSGHNEYANKACPGFRVEPWLMSDSPKAPPAIEVPRQQAGWFSMRNIFSNWFKSLR